MSNIIYCLDEIYRIVDEIISLSQHRLVCFRGELGAGKTTLIKAFLRKIGAADSGSSPTFGLVNEYLNADGELLAYHLDCYRIQDTEEALDFGIEEYLEADCWIFVEWPEHIESLLPKERTELRVEQLGEDQRKLTINP